MSNPAIIHTDIQFTDEPLGSPKLLSTEFRKVTKISRGYQIATAAMPSGARVNLSNDTLANNGSATVTVITDMSSTLGSTPLPETGSEFAKNSAISIYRNGIQQYKGIASGDGDVGWFSNTTIQINNELAIGEIINVEIATAY